MANYSFQYQIKCNGNVVDTATVSGTIAAIITADAVDDTASGQAGATITVDVTPNDTLCTGGATTTFQAKNAVNCTVSGGTNDGKFSVALAPLYAGDSCQASFDYDILCDGAVKDTATVTIQRSGSQIDMSNNFIQRPVWDFSGWQDGRNNTPYSLPNGWVSLLGFIGSDSTGYTIEDVITASPSGNLNDAAWPTFSGDPSRNLPAEPGIVYFPQGLATVADVDMLKYTVSGLTPGKTYKFGGYVAGRLIVAGLDPTTVSPAALRFKLGNAQSPVAEAPTVAYDAALDWRSAEGTFVATSPTADFIVEYVQSPTTGSGDYNQTIGRDPIVGGLYVYEAIECP